MLKAPKAAIRWPHGDQVDSQAVVGGTLRQLSETTERGTQAAEAVPVNALQRAATAIRAAQLHLDGDQHRVHVDRDDVDLALRRAPAATKDRPAAPFQPGGGRLLGPQTEQVTRIGQVVRSSLGGEQRAVSRLVRSVPR